MPRLSIDITPEEHSRLKAMAALKGQSIKDFVLKRTLGEAPAVEDMSENDARAALSEFLKPHITGRSRQNLLWIFVKPPISGLASDAPHGEF